MTKPKLKRDDKEQSERFKEKAREIEADNSKEIFERALKTILSKKQESS